MAEYYPLIAHALSGLDASAPGESRRALYERARDALITQLRSVQPPLTETEITRERLSLEEAIRKVESEMAQRARDFARTDSKGRSRPGDVFRAGSRAAAARQAERGATRPAFVSNGPSLNDAFRVGSRSGPTVDPLAELEELIRGEPNFSDRDAGIATQVGQRVALPPISAIPEQDENRAIAFRPTRRGPLDLQPAPVSDPLDPEQSQLYLRIRAQLENLKEEIPNQERAQINGAINDFLDQPPSWDQVAHKRVLWLCGNALRQSLAQHDAVQSLPEPHYSKLPPGVAETLRKPVEAWNVFILGDSELTNLDAIRMGPKEQSVAIGRIDAARPIVELAKQDRNITTERASKAIEISLKAIDTPNDDLNKKQAQALAAGTSQNLIVQIIRRAYLFCDDILNPQTEEAKALSKEFKFGAAKAAGAATVTAIVGTALFAGPYAASFFEFVATNAGPFRAYIAAAFQNNQLNDVINTIEFTRSRLLSGK